MKKCFLLFISTVLLLTGCNAKNDSQNVKTQDEKIAMDISEKEDIIITNGKELFSNEEEYCNIIYFDSKQIIFAKDGSINKELDTVNVLFYHYNLKNGNTEFLTEVENISLSTEDIAYLDNRLYYPLSVKSKEGLIEYILEISLDNFSTRLVKSRETDTIGTRLEATDSEVYRYYQKKVSENETEFFIDNIGTLDTSKRIIHEKYKKNTGSILVSSCVYNDKMYTYSIICGDDEKYVVEEYSLEGELLKQYQIDLKGFLKMKEVDDTDAVYQMYIEEDYIILNTLNNRIKIYKIVEDHLLEVATPPEFEELLGARVLDQYGDSDYVYFLDSTKSNILYIFDTDQGKISKFNLAKSNIKVDNVVRDDEGNLIVITEHTDNKCRYFLIDSDTILSKIK